MNKQEKEVISSQLDSEAAVLKSLENQYKQALEDIGERIKLLQADEMTQSKIYQIEYQKSLQKQVQAILDKLNGDEYSTIHQYLSESYTDAYVGTMYDIAGQGIPVIAPIDQNAAVKAIMTDSKINEGLYNHIGVDVKKLKKNISSEITRGIATGLSYSEMARNISDYSRAPLSRAKTIVRTEGHRVQQASANDARNAAKDRGCNVVKQWSAILDGSTRPDHQMLDGQIKETNESFTIGLLSAMFPGDFGDASEDCNCRCRANTRAKWALDESELERLKKRAEHFELDKTKDFNDFKSKYLKAAESSQRSDAQKTDDARQAEIKARREAYNEREANKVKKAVVPDFGTMDADQIRAWASSNLATRFSGADGANRDYLAETTKAIAKFENKMGGKTIDGLSVRFGGLPSGVYAKYDDKTNTLMLKKSGSIQSFVESQEKANARYAAKWHNGKDYYATTSFGGTVFHELGHAVDIDTGQSLSKALAKDKALFETSVQVSSYAGSSQNVRVSARSEAWAENFAAYMEGGKNSSKLPDEIVEMIEGYFSSKRK